MGQGPSFWFDTRIYLAVSAALVLVIVYYNHFIAVVGAILLYVLYLYGRERHAIRQREITAYLESMSSHVDQASFFALQHLPLAIAILDQAGVVHWKNGVLTQWTQGQLEIGEPLSKVWPEFGFDAAGKKVETEVFHTGDKHYRVMYVPLNEGASPMFILYIMDITAIEAMRTKCHQAMPVFAYIQIDNYDDVLKGLNESQRTTILAEVNQLLVEWATGLDGFLKKYTEDMYIAVFNRQALDRLMNDKFEILDRIRTIQAGNKIPVTLSMGLATEDSPLAALAQKAQAGLDLALGRGGDQVSVYLDSRVQFFGGKAKAIEKNTRVKARIVAQAIREMLEDCDLALVMGHVGEDFDSLGAALGVAKMARALGKPVHVVVSHPGLAVDKLAEILPEGAEYQEVFINGTQALSRVTSRTLLFVVDTHRPELVAASELLSEVDKVIVIDHHRRAEVFIANPLLIYLEPSASSTSELVTELLLYFDERLDLTRFEATALYAGIIVDTKHFAVQTGVRTFDAASYLRRAGADPSLVRHLFRVDFETVKARAAVINHTEMLPGGVVISVCSDVKNAQVVASQAADMLLGIEGVKVSFVLFPLEDGVGVSARSQGDVNVQVIMEQIGGGGHQTVAGARVKNAGLEDVKQQVIEIITSYIKESESE
ncbi:Hypothetical protein LUCI_2776 [Lucifera butyrica]|uniref:Cyclic-di-AMP phosphodiesterase n=1 Tax=Lucifera butyrica TaxID=1351585 RepID=A0A498R9A0_9FIRM|nr:DHH family phosphoesterase [Lucifera butyrica]VBB07527.1 Hypothetical protein LUCI_2776 [Lucifera butyrica]